MSEIDTARTRDLFRCDHWIDVMELCDEIDRLRHECRELTSDQNDNLIHHRRQQKQHETALIAARAEALEEAAKIADAWTEYDFDGEYTAKNIAEEIREKINPPSNK